MACFGKNKDRVERARKRGRERENERRGKRLVGKEGEKETWEIEEREKERKRNDKNWGYLLFLVGLFTLFDVHYMYARIISS